MLTVAISNFKGHLLFIHSSTFIFPSIANSAFLHGHQNLNVLRVLSIIFLRVVPTNRHFELILKVLTLIRLAPLKTFH